MSIQVFSSGGGTQSSAIAALICQGVLPKPDFAAIVDTEREMSTTWDYLDNVVRPALAKVGVEIVRIKKSDYATVDLYRNDDILIPAFTTETGEVGKLPTFCSNEWKSRVLHRWLRDKGVKSADVWIGFTIDEMRRCKQKLDGAWRDRYVLIERRMTRGDCIASVQRMGWPEPPRSACWMCPNKPRHEWQWMKDNAPEDFAKAASFQRQIQMVDEDLWLTEDAKPLEEIDFSAGRDLFTGRCDSGMCYV